MPLLLPAQRHKNDLKDNRNGQLFFVNGLKVSGFHTKVQTEEPSSLTSTEVHCCHTRERKKDHYHVMKEMLSLYKSKESVRVCVCVSVSQISLRIRITLT